MPGLSEKCSRISDTLAERTRQTRQGSDQMKLAQDFKEAVMGRTLHDQSFVIFKHQPLIGLLSSLPQRLPRVKMTGAW